MKSYKIKRAVMDNDNKVLYSDTLYTFESLKEAQKRLVNICDACKFKVIKHTKNSFQCDKGYSKLIFAIEK